MCKIHIDKITVGESSVKPVKMVSNLGAWFDSPMSMNSHIGKVCSKAVCSLQSLHHPADQEILFGRNNEDFGAFFRRMTPRLL